MILISTITILNIIYYYDYVHFIVLYGYYLSNSLLNFNVYGDILTTNSKYVLLHEFVCFSTNICCL